MRRREFFAGLAASTATAQVLRAGDGAPAVVALTQWKTLPGIRGLEPAFEYLVQLDPAKVSPGRTAILGDDVFAVASKYVTQPSAELRFEAHRTYIDVQYLVSGQETIGFCPSIQGLAVVEPYDAAKDIAFYAAPERETSLRLKAGEFVVIEPGQAHRPGSDLDGHHDIVKIVVKVSAAWRARRG